VKQNVRHVDILHEFVSTYTRTRRHIKKKHDLIVILCKGVRISSASCKRN